MSHESLGKSDEWYTPKYIFDALECEFDIDAAAPVDRTFCHVPAKRYITELSLSLSWNGFVWLNPPFEGRNDKKLWLEKMAFHGNGIVLTPDRSSTDWWQDAAKKSNALLMVRKKIQFIRPDGSLGLSPSNGTTLFAYGDQAVFSLRRAEKNNLGITLIK
jgi:hypothetical protein